ncbi:MAG: tRNA(Ser) Um(44) 2'-O-methyltransferase [Cirrosporium novae-zelandiae]|nr:MAG: tRNA(Ser) Um(44) 2'-O-methyltransferase [Cirrosporium novae-zelandiae]
MEGESPKFLGAVNLLSQAGRWELACSRTECTFPPSIFMQVMLNLVERPNINSSHLFRADILYDSRNPQTSKQINKETEKESLEDTRPAPAPECDHLRLDFTIVRRFIPRNPNLDSSLIQTCHFYSSFQQESPTATATSEDSPHHSAVIYIPHANTPSSIPWYHPVVQQLLFHYSYFPPSPNQPQQVQQNQQQTTPNTLTLYYLLFPPPSPQELTPRLVKTASNLLTTIAKHSHNQQSGYQKRVIHDTIIPQKRLQDTYTRLKLTHAKRLSSSWVESTDPSKHVFEDLLIVAFLVELWRDLYNLDPCVPACEKASKMPHGFVDIGCGNGILVCVLLREGYRGWGFDARRRKTWATFEPEIQSHLEEMMLIPQQLLSPTQQDQEEEQQYPPTETNPKIHTGVFPPHTFLISNHADELTPWTPLLASLSQSPFLAIPCCSHALNGSRFRFSSKPSQPPTTPPTNPNPNSTSGSLTTLKAHRIQKQESTYASLCSYVIRLARECGFEVRTEWLRIPSTRNMGIVGWVGGGGAGEGEGGGRDDGVTMTTMMMGVEGVREIVRREGGAEGFGERIEGLRRPGNGGH